MRFLVKKEKKIERFERRRRRKIAKNERKTYLQSDLSAAGAEKSQKKSPAALGSLIFGFERRGGHSYKSNCIILYSVFFILGFF